MRWRSALVTASSAALLAACGGGGDRATRSPPRPPRIPAGVAQRLAAEADRVAALTPGTCVARDAAARFRAEVIASVDRIPRRYQEPLMSAANDLAARLGACEEPRRDGENDDDHGRGHGRKHGRG